MLEPEDEPFPTSEAGARHSIYGARINELHTVLADIIEQAAKEGCLLVDDPTVAAEQFLALIRGELHPHCLYDPSFRPSGTKIERQINAGVDCFMARCGAPAELV
jgi:transcriptional repressor AefR-like protein